MTVHLLLIALSLVLLFVGAEGLVRGSSSLALRAGISPLVVGLTVVAFGTSAPELVVSLKAAAMGQGDIAVGNVVGSNIFNIGVILGLAALICPIPVKLRLIRVDLPVLLISALLVPVLLMNGVIGRWEGGCLFAVLIVYVVANVVMAKKETSAEVATEFEEGVPPKSGSPWLDVAMLIVGLGVLVYGSTLLVEHSVIVARSWGVSEAVIGLTIVATGTSMPELVTSVVAAWKKEPDIAVGNVIGSNIFNVMSILGLSSLVMPLESEGIQFMDYAFMIGLSLMLVPLLWSGMRLLRIEGALLMAGYGVYVALLWPK